MRLISNIVGPLLMGCLLTGCVTTNETPLTPNAFRLDTSASGLLYTGSAGQETLLRAATLTQQKGFSYFTIVNSATASGSTYAGATAGFIGNTLLVTPTWSPTQDISVVVQMSNEPSPGAWLAADVIAKKGKV